MISPGEVNSLEDCGGGGGHLKKMLPENIEYIPIDYIEREYVDGLVKRDFNNHEFYLKHVDVMFLSGILEYITDYKWFISMVCEWCYKAVAISYNCFKEDEETISDREERGWISHISSNELIDEFSKNNFYPIKTNTLCSEGIQYPELYLIFVRREQ